MGRLDRGWQGNADARQSIPRPPSSYQKQLYYDTVVGSEAALRRCSEAASQLTPSRQPA